MHPPNNASQPQARLKANETISRKGLYKYNSKASKTMESNEKRKGISPSLLRNVKTPQLDDQTMLLLHLSTISLCF